MQDENLQLPQGHGGSPDHEPTEETRAQVSALASFGVPQENIALYIDIDPKTLRKHYRRELDIGRIHGNAQMAGRLFKAGMQEGSVAAMIFWMKSQAGWREIPVEGTDDETAIIPTSITIERKDARIAQ